MEMENFKTKGQRADIKYIYNKQSGFLNIE